jgi:hypothetical protein
LTVQPLRRAISLGAMSSDFIALTSGGVVVSSSILHHSSFCR